MFQLAATALIGGSGPNSLLSWLGDADEAIQILGKQPNFPVALAISDRQAEKIPQTLHAQPNEAGAAARIAWQTTRPIGGDNGYACGALNP
jgi:hypothetical protein